MRASEIMNRWRPGSYDPPWTWLDEMRDLAGPEQDLLTEYVRANGVPGRVYLGNDGRVWDGHHRLIAAYQAGDLDVPWLEL